MESDHFITRHVCHACEVVDFPQTKGRDLSRPQLNFIFDEADIHHEKFLCVSWHIGVIWHYVEFYSIL